MKNCRHQWRQTKARYEVCVLCSTRFPCAGAGCGHADCHLARGEAPPPGVVPLCDSCGVEPATAETSWRFCSTCRPPRRAAPVAVVDDDKPPWE